MPLSKIQKLLLDTCAFGEELQAFLARELGEDGHPQSNHSPDFLHILCNMLQITENRLNYLRMKLSRAININGHHGIVAEPTPEVAILEEEIKHTWSRAAALWRATDLVVRFPEDYGLRITLKHVEYALSKNNLPVIEMIKWAKPEFFAIQQSPAIIRYLVCFIGSTLGAVLGLFGGFVGGIKQVDRLPSMLRPFAIPFYAIAGVISGSAMGLLVGGELGLQTGNLMIACQLAAEASYLNPFHDPRGSKYQQAVELRKEEVLFELSHPHLKKKGKGFLTQ